MIRRILGLIYHLLNTFIKIDLNVYMFDNIFKVSLNYVLTNRKFL